MPRPSTGCKATESFLFGKTFLSSSDNPCPARAWVFFVVTLLLISPAINAAEPLADNNNKNQAPREEKENRQVPEKIPLIDLNMMETDQLRLLYFAPAQSYLTPYLGRSAIQAIQYHRKMLNWQPWEKNTLLLKDFSDHGNAAARSAPNNALLIDVAPLSLAYETFSPGERFFTLANHEITHIAQMDLWNKRDAFWRKLFGGKPLAEQQHPESILYNYLVNPRANVPRWFLEGSAVFMETWMAGGFGRAQGAYDEMVFRSMVRDQARFYSALGLESEGTSIDFQVGVNDYLYGTRFFSWLAYTYSPEQVIQWLKRDEDSAAYYSRHFEHVFSISLKKAWANWIAWEKEFQQANLEKIREYRLSEYTPLSPEGLGSVSRMFPVPGSNKILAAFRYPGVITHIGLLDTETGGIEKLQNIKGPMLYKVTSLAYDPEHNRAWYTSDNYAYRDIHELDIKTGKSHMLLKDSRIGDLVYRKQDKSLWGLRHLNGYVTLVRIPSPYQRWNQVHTFDFGRTVFDLDISPDGELLSASVGEIDGRQSVQIYRIEDLLTGNTQAFKKFELGASTPEGFVFSPDGHYLYGSAYFTGVSNIFRYQLANEDISVVSNTDTGFFRPVVNADGSLLALSYSGKGLQPVRFTPEVRQDLNSVNFLGAMIANKHPVVTRWGAGSPDKVDLQSLVTNEGKYHPEQEMKLGGLYPVLESYLGKTAAGIYGVFEDPLQFSQFKFSFTVSHDPDRSFSENLHLDIEYKTINWSFRYWHNDADFYDFFGPTERARKGDAAIISYHKSMLYDPPRKLDLDIGLSWYTGLDTLPSAQEVNTGFDSMGHFDARLAYSHSRKSLGGVTDEKGWRWHLQAALDYADGEYFTKFQSGLDAGLPLPVKNASVWLYNAAGTINGDENSVLSRYYFGAFGNNKVDDGEIQRYRHSESLPGFEINQLSARQYYRSLLELNLPPVRFSEVGTEAFYLKNLQTAVFAGQLWTRNPEQLNQEYQTFGMQVDLNFTIIHRLPMTLSLGIARGYQDGEGQDKEYLLSLKIL